MCQKESLGAIIATKEAHSTQRGQPLRMHGPGLWRYEQKEQRVTPVSMSGVNCDLSWTAKISKVGRSKTQDTPPNHGPNTEHNPLLEGQPVEYVKHVGRYVSSSIGMPPMRRAAVRITRSRQPRRTAGRPTQGC